jgi:hypothetical protein
MVLYQICVFFGADLISNMAARDEHFCQVWFKSFCGFRKKDENVKFP